MCTAYLHSKAVVALTFNWKTVFSDGLNHGGSLPVLWHVCLASALPSRLFQEAATVHRKHMASCGETS